MRRLPPSLTCLILVLALLTPAIALHDPSYGAFKESLNASPRRNAQHNKSRESSIPKTNPRQAFENTYSKLPMSFEPNQGQSETQADFIARGSGYSVFLTSTEAVLAINRPQASTTMPTAQGKPVRVDRLRAPLSKSQLNGPSQDFVRMKLFDANAKASKAGLKPLPGKSNYFAGRDRDKWITNVAQYEKVEYTNVYDGVDLVYYGKQGQLEFDFVIDPGADPEKINLGYEGINGISLDPEGNLVLNLAAGKLVQERPVAYQLVNQTRKEVFARYLISENNRISFKLGDYDRRQPLVIDPTFIFSTYLGGNGQDEGFAIVVDSSGNSYVTGRTTSTNFPTANAFRTSNSGATDIFVTKLNPAGTSILYSTYIGGLGDEEAFSIALNANREAYLTGYTTSTNFPLIGALQPFFGGGSTDAFLVRLNATGNALVTSTYAGGSGQDVATGIALDGAGNIYGVGFTSSIDLPTVNPIQPFNAGGFDGFVLKVSPSANSITFATYAGGSSDDFGNAIAVDSLGSVYAIGDTQSTNLTTVNPLQSFNAGGFDAFLAKLSPSGNSIVFSTYAGGNGDDSGRGITLDGSGNILATGYTNSTNLALIVNAVQPAKGTGYDAFLSKLTSNGGTVLYSTFLGGNGTDAGYSVTTDTMGNAYVTGETSSTNLVVVSPVQATNGGLRDAFVTKLNPSGSAIVFSSYLGGSAEDIGFGLAADETGAAYVTGRTASTNFPTASALRPSLTGTLDAFVSKISTAVSSGGPKIAFGSKRNGGNHDIHIMDQDGTNQTRLTNHAAYDDQPKWSPNGSKIAFMSNRDGNFEIYSMNADGTNITRLTNNPNADGFPAWSPDGNRIAFVSGALNDPATAEVFVMNADGSNRTRLTNDSLIDGVPAWSPDGSRIVFMSGAASLFDPNSFEIFVINADGSNRTRLTTNAVADGQPSYSPDGSRILFASGSAMNPDGIEIFVMDTNGSNRIQLTSNSQTDGFPEWSPDGTKIIFASGSIADETTVELFVMNADGSNRTRLTNNSLLDWFPDWQPSGAVGGVQFTVAAFSVNEGGGSAQIIVSRTDTVSAATVNYATADTAGLTECNVVNGIGSSRCDYATTLGILRFAAGESSKTIFVPIVDDAYAEGNETFAINLNNPSGIPLGAITSATITIQDNETVNGANPIDGVDFFIRQQYIDFLGREPDPGGLAGWRNVLNNCGITVAPPCDRIEVSAGFFRSEEFQSRGYFIYRFFSVLGRIPVSEEFYPDFAKVSGFLTADQLEANKAAYVNEVMSRADFQTKYGSTLNNPTAYVEALLQTVGLPSHPSKQSWINTLNASNTTTTRGQVLRQLVESVEVYNKYYNEAFVIMQYFGYLRRTADASYLSWIQTMNNTNGDYRIMINGFMNSAEYRRRFGP
ncbi:MAG TPA: SBBP repeat-containing protein [Pyrinomonadaceae bacterium]|nr:SBBP repeat-containing protein [Pyrinomonadaceae bacterium]